MIAFARDNTRLLSLREFMFSNIAMAEVTLSEKEFHVMFLGFAYLGAECTFEKDKITLLKPKRKVVRRVDPSDHSD